MTRQDFDHWLRRYGAAWEAKDAAAFCVLFTEDIHYYWTPFEEPKKGRGEVEAAFSTAVANQRDIHFRYEILAVDQRQCLARWWCVFSRPATGQPVGIDGILFVKPGGDVLCEEFREWWHSDE